jgi:type I restriction enzyme S subunit
MENQSAIIVGRKGSAGALVISDGPSWTTDVAYYIVPPAYFDIGFLFLQLKAMRLDALSKGVKPGLSRSDMNLLQLVVPPLAEQHRIVTKVEELMALCDQLELAQKERELHRDELRDTSLHKLTSPGHGADKSNDLRFFFDKSSRLITKREHVAAVRQSILDLAMRGHLVPEVVSDKAVAESLALSDEVRSMAAARDRRADAGQQVLLNPELCWEVPKHWEWRGLADLVLFIDYRGRTPEKVATGVRLITAKNVRRQYIALEPEEFISEAEYDLWMTRGFPKVGDVLFTTEAPMGNAAVARLSEKFALAQRVIDLRSYGSIDPDFLVLQLTSELFKVVLEATATGLTAKGIKAAKLKRLPMAVPPLGEQRRIAAKVGELMSVCDELETALDAAQHERGRLLEALLHDAMSGNAPAVGNHS